MATASSPLRHVSGQYNSSQLPVDDRSNANLSFLGHVRQIRAEAQNLIRYACELKGKLMDPHLNITDVVMEWQAVQLPIYQQHQANVKDLFALIRKLMEDCIRCSACNSGRSPGLPRLHLPPVPQRQCATQLQ